MMVIISIDGKVKHFLHFGLDPSRIGPVAYIHFSDNLGGGLISW